MVDPLADAVGRYQRAVGDIERAKLAAKRQVEAARRRRDVARDALAAAIVVAARAGKRQRDIVATTGLTRERVRQICRNAGIDPQ